MKKTILFLLAGWALSGLGTINAVANIGDTYSQSCARFHGKGYIDKERHLMAWSVPDANKDQGASNWLLEEQFLNNRCVMLFIISKSPKGIEEGGLWQFLSQNSSPSQRWVEYPSTSQERSFATSDDKLYGLYFVNQDGMTIIRIALKSWLYAHNLLNNPSEKAPVEDDIIGYTGPDKTSIKSVA